MRRERIYCECGATLQRPLPSRCPRCQRPIVGLRRRWWSWLLPLIVIGGGLAILVGYTLWLAGR